ncbi:MAG: Rrf2 family transcriptional regulator [Clostridia bacterium]|nr:Rrf2 family transcriptional regulator [Clostridia bacterium]
MKISSKAHYGLQAVFILAKTGDVVSAKTLESEIGVSCKYLERIMRILTNAGVVQANRGIQGGYYLAKPANKTTAGEVVRALEDQLEIIDCVTGNSCNKCGTSFVWKKLYQGINDILNGITLSDMVSADLLSSLEKQGVIEPCDSSCEQGCKSCSKKCAE